MGWDYFGGTPMKTGPFKAVFILQLSKEKDRSKEKNPGVQLHGHRKPKNQKQP
jgi:hypothetical protein